MVMISTYPDAPYTNPLEVGAKFLDFVMETLNKHQIIFQPYTSRQMQYYKGESVQGWEVKLDNRFTDTGRLSIEIAEKTARGNSNWIPSGIYRNDNTCGYIQGNYQYFYFFHKDDLINLHKTRRYIEDEYNGTIRKYYLPISDADKYGIKITP